MRTYYIYKATNKFNGKSYIGVTIDFKSRVWQHIRCYDKEDCLFHRAIKKYGYENFEWQVLDTCYEKSKSVELEKYYIELYNTYRDGYNQNKGGVGGHNSRSVVCLSKDGDFIKKYDSAADAEKDGFNNVNVLLCCKNELITCKNYIFMFEDEYIKFGAKKYIKPKLHNVTPVIQCDKNGNFIERFESVNSASNITGIPRTRISSCLTGCSKHAYDYIFVYEKDFPIKDISKYHTNKKGKKIAQVDINTNEIIEIFDRISDAGKKLGVNYKSIHKVIDKEGRTAYGYKWISQ